MARSRRKSSRNGSSGSGSASSNPALAQSSGGANSVGSKDDAGGGLFGWAKGAGNWIADKWDSTTDAVGDWVQDVGDGARELHQAWSATDLGMEDGKITLDTDLDEIADVLPENALGGLKLAEGGEDGNKVHVELDRKTGELTITSGDLRVAGMNQDGMSTGPISLQGVRITVTNHDGGIPFIDGDFSLFGFKDKDDNVAVDVLVDSVVASAISFQGEDGPITVDSMLLSGFSLNAASQGGVPFGDKGATAARFAVGNAVLRGVSAAGTNAEQVEINELGGGIQETAETAYLSAGSVTGSNMSRDGAKLGSATLNDVRADVRNEGGGLLLLDDQEDRMKANVTVASATVNDASSADASLQSASMGDLSVFHDATQGRTEVDAGSIGMTGLDTAQVDVASAGMNDLSVDLDKNGQSFKTAANVGSVRASGIDAAGTQAGSVEAKGLSVNAGGQGSDIHGEVGLDSLAANDIRSGDASVASVSATHLIGTHDSVGSAISGDTLSVTGAAKGQDSVGSLTMNEFYAGKNGDKLDAEVVSLAARDARIGSADASVDAVDISRLSGSFENGEIAGASDSINVSGARQGDGVSVDNVNVAGFSGGYGSNGAASGRADAVTVDNAKVNDFSVGRTEATGVQASKTAVGANFGAQGVAMDDLQAYNLKAGRVEASHAAGSIDGSDMTGSLGSGHVTDLQLNDRISIADAKINEVQSGVKDGVRSTTIADASVNGVSDSVTGASVQQGDVSNVSLENTGSQYNAKVGIASVQGIDAMGAKVASAGATGLDVSTGAAGHRGSVNELQVNDASYGDTAKLDEAIVRNASGSLDTDGNMNASVRRVDVAGGEFSDKGTTASAQNAAITHGELSRDKNGNVSGGIGKVSALNAGFSSAAKSEPSESSLNIDQASLMKTGLARVDNADVRASIGLKEGEYDAGIGIGVEKNEALDVNLKVRDNQMVGGQGGTKARFREGLDTPLWTSLAGAEVDKDGKLIANIDGFFDQNVSKKVNEGVGLEGKKLHSLAAYGEATADMISAPATNSAPEKSDGPGLDQAFDTSTLAVQGRVGLSAGEIDAGDAKATLASEAGANEVAISSRPGEDLVFSFAKFLASTLSVNVGGQSIDAGNTSLTNAELAVDQNSAPGSVAGQVGAVQIEDVKLNR